MEESVSDAAIEGQYGYTLAFVKTDRTEREMTDTKAVGRVIKVSKEGWGFISSKEIQFTRIFFHWTALKQDTVPFLELKTGMTVEFTPIQIPGKGYRAIHVRVIEKEVTNDTPAIQVSPLSE